MYCTWRICVYKKSISYLVGIKVVEVDCMEHFSTMFSGLAKSLKKVKSSGNCGGRGAVETMVKEAKKNDLILRSSGTLNVDGSNNFAAISSKRGNKGVNQDCCIVWEVIYEQRLVSLTIAYHTFSP